MSHPTADPLLDDLRRLHLLEPDQLDELARSAASFPSEPKALAQELMRRGWLTPYQVNRLLQGRGRELLLGSYVLLERLGEGGMGAVFKARNWKLGAVRALKIIRKERIAQANAVQRFQREMRAAAQLSHPNVVHAHDADEVDGTHFIAMELLSGVDLARRVADGGPLPVEQACEYIRQAALGLQHAHERGMVHRDVKPQNLLLTAEGVVKVLDLGLARLAPSGDGTESSGTLTQPDSLMGTPDYMAPEQARQSHTVDGRADLYSLGATLYFLLAGRPPFAGGPLAAVIAALLFEEPTPLKTLRPDVPPAVAAVVRKLMAKKPEDRYQSGAELADVLASILKGEAVVEPPLALPVHVVPFPPSPTPASWLGETVSASGDAPEPPPAAVPKRRRVPVVAYLAGGATLLVSMVVAWFVTSRMTTPVVAPPAAPGTLMATCADPDVRILVHRKGQTDATEKKVNESVELPPGDYDLEPAAAAPPGLRLSSAAVTIRSGQTETVRIDGVPLSADALVSRPAWIDGAKTWTIETRDPGIVLNPLAVSPDGRWMAGAAPDGTIRLLDARTGEVRRSLGGHPGRVHLLAWSPDADHPTLASAGADLLIRLWDPVKGQLTPSRFVAATAMAWSPDGKLLAYAAGQTVYLWDPVSQQTTTLPQVARQPSRTLAWAPDGWALAVAGADFVDLWRAPAVPNGDWVDAGARPCPGPIDALAWAPDGRTFASAGADGNVRLWDAGDPKKPEKVLAASGAVNAVAWPAGDATTVAAIGADGALRLWDAVSGEPRRTVPLGRNPGTFAPDGRLIAAAGGPGSARLREAATGRPLGTLVLLSKGTLVLSEDGHYRCYPDRFWTVKDIENQLSYVVQTEKGSMKYTPDEFAARCHWKNDPDKARLDTRMGAGN